MLLAGADADVASMQSWSLRLLLLLLLPLPPLLLASIADTSRGLHAWGLLASQTC